MGAGGGGRPTAICQTTGHVLGPKTIFDSSLLEVSEYAEIFYLNVTDDVTDRVKGPFFIICHCWIRLAKQPYQMEIKPIERHGRYLRYL